MKLRSALALAVALCCAPADAAMQNYQYQAANLQTGMPLPGARVTIYNFGTLTRAKIYDSTGAPLANPLTADPNGVVAFQADNATAYQAIWSSGRYISPLWTVNGGGMPALAIGAYNVLPCNQQPTLSLTGTPAQPLLNLGLPACNYTNAVPLPTPTLTALGGVLSALAPSEQYMAGVDLVGRPVWAQLTTHMVGAALAAGPALDATTAASARASLGVNAGAIGAALAAGPALDLRTAAAARQNLGFPLGGTFLSAGLAAHYGMSPTMVCDGVTDTSADLQVFIDANKGKRIVIDENLKCVAHVVLNGASYNGTFIDVRGTLKTPPAPAGGGTNFQSAAWTSLVFYMCDKCGAQGNFDGNRANQPQQEQIYPILVAGATNAYFPFISCSEIRGDCLNATRAGLQTKGSQNCANLTIGTLVATNSADDGRNAVSLISCDTVNIGSITSNGVGGTVNGALEPGCLDIEPDDEFESVTNVTVGALNCRTAGTNGLGIGGRAVYLTIATTAGSTTVNYTASAQTLVRPGSKLFYTGGPSGGVIVTGFTASGATGTMTLQNAPTATASGVAAAVLTNVTSNIRVGAAIVVNTSPSNQNDAAGHTTVNINHTMAIQNAMYVQVDGFSGTCLNAYCGYTSGNGALNVVNADNVRIKGTLQHVAQGPYLNADLYSAQPSLIGVVNSDIDVTVSDIARYGFTTGVVNQTRVRGVARRPQAGYFAGSTFAVYSTGSATQDGVIYGVDVPYDANWTRAYRNSGIAFTSASRISGANFGPNASGWGAYLYMKDMPILIENSPGYTDGPFGVPANAPHVAGQYIRNGAPASGSPKGWYCTVTGTPGTWISEGNL